MKEMDLASSGLNPAGRLASVPHSCLLSITGFTEEAPAAEKKTTRSARWTTSSWTNHGLTASERGPVAVNTETNSRVSQTRDQRSQSSERATNEDG